VSFFYPFIVLLQPGIIWPGIAPYRPIIWISVATLLYSLMRRDALPQLAQKLAQPIFIWFSVYVLLQVVSVHYGGLGAMLEIVDFWDAYAVFVLVSMLLISDVTRLYRFIAGMLAGSAVVIGYGLYAVATHSPYLEGNRAGAYGMYQNHNDYTFIILMALPFAYVLIGVTQRWLFKVLLVVFVGACLAGTLLSLSRGGILALVLMLGLLYWKTTSGTRRMMGIVALSIIGSVAIVWQFSAREENQRGHYTAEDAKNSRYELWRAARKIIEQHPILGIGSGRFGEHAKEYAELSHNNVGKVTHNTYLEVATGSGLLGLAAFLMMIWNVVKESTANWRTSRSGVPPPIMTATQVCMLTIIVRAMLDAKTYDWSFYFLAVIGIAIATIKAIGEEVSGPQSQVAVRKVPTTGRPAVYGRRA
jgi:O-antigen ligase